MKALATLVDGRVAHPVYSADLAQRHTPDLLKQLLPVVA
jgi:hypothetical protein